MTITTEEQQKFWAIFSGLDTSDGYLSGNDASQVLAKSGLSDDKLADIWDRADIDSDGRLDFEEFCIAMKLTFDLISGSLVAVPASLPDDLVPASKAHIIAANSALINGNQVEGVPDIPSQEGLQGGFEWYYSPADKGSYESIYSTNADRRGGIKFDSLSDLYSTLNVPESEIKRAWNLVNPRSQEGIGKDQCLVFLHILNQRHQGIRIPDSIPASLQATFRKSEISYDTSKYDRDGTIKSQQNSQAATFGKGYLAKKGITARSEVDNSDSIKDEQWSRIQLQNKIKELDSILATPHQTSEVVLVRNELQKLLEFKKSELARLDAGTKGGMEGVRADVEMFKDQVDALSAHLETRKQELQRLMT